jgi:glutamate racemase
MARRAADIASTVPVFDLIGATAEHAAGTRGNIGVMATLATARSQAFSNAIRGHNSAANVFEYGCPELVPIVEGGTIGSEHCTRVLSSYIEQFRRDQLATVVLGCTHFPFLRAQLEKLSGGEINFLDPAQILTGSVDHELQASYLCDLYVTGDRRAFARNARNYLGDIPSDVRSIGIEELEVCRAESNIAMLSESVSASAVQTVV